MIFFNSTKEVPVIPRTSALIVLVGLALLASPTNVEAFIFSECQFCWKASAIPVGICLDVVDPTPMILTLSDCTGISRCYQDGSGQIYCQADCRGTPCYWV
jgi:hypothetical protein